MCQCAPRQNTVVCGHASGRLTAQIEMEVLAARDRGRDAPSARELVARRPAPWRGAKRRAVCAVAGVELDGAYLPRKRQRQTQAPAPRRTRGPAGATLRWPIRSAES